MYDSLMTPLVAAFVFFTRSQVSVINNLMTLLTTPTSLYYMYTCLLTGFTNLLLIVR